MGCVNVPGAGAGDAAGGLAGATFTAALHFLTLMLHEPWPPRAKPRNGSRFDMVVVGGGTAGAALAVRLVQGTGLRVLLLEAGPPPPLDSIVPGFKSVFPSSQYDWNFTTTDDGYSSQHLVGHRQRLACGKILGGGGSINSMIYSRGSPDDYDEWASILGDHTWNWTNVLPYFKKTETLTDGRIRNDPSSKKYHGTKGEIEVAGLDRLNFDTVKILEAFAEIGFNVVEDRNNPNMLGAGHLSFTIKDGKRQSTVTAMLNKVAKQDNLHVITNALVTKILIRNDSAYGVRAQIDNSEFEFYANKEVILSAGTFNTPKLLMLSGIGPREHLQQLGIKVVKNLPVGDNLQDHVSVYTYIAAENGTCFSDEASKHMDVMQYLFNRTGSLSVPSRIGIDYSLKNSPSQNVPDFSIFPGCVSVNNNYYDTCLKSTDFNPKLCAHLDAINKKYELLPIYVVLRKPKSRGRVSLNSTNVMDKPVIFSGTFTNSDDLEAYPEALDAVWSLVNTTYFKSKRAFVVDFGLEECDKLKYLEKGKCLALSLAKSDWHFVGTAAMGSVLDSRFKVLGLRRLRVVDASAMPTVVRGNTNYPVVMLAEKAANFIKNEYRFP